MSTPRSGGRGFTLVEVMVALTILSLVMLATITGFRTLANTQAAVERLTERVDEVRTVSSFLRDAFEAVVIGSGVSGLTLGGSPGGNIFFRVFPEAVEWRSVILFGESYGGSYLLRIGREQDALVLRWLESGALRKSLDWTNAPSRVLVSGLEELKISYKRDVSGAWQDQWDAAGAPSLLRLQIKTAGKYWPELLFRVR